MKNRLGLKFSSTALPPEPPKKEDKASRAGKKAVTGYFSLELSRALHILERV